uniref:Chitin-binding type-1 domain-containing protein n=1 Tax=Spongospora subterranea TaxID=70186 RepID=A0A0H5RK69_9EUKA|eukprot:CRZ09124.1 hypothetical protein [Spongospora subterranea]
MRATIVVCLIAVISYAVAENCGPLGGNVRCGGKNCCSRFGWCGATDAHCDPATCNKQFSAPASSCASQATNPLPSDSPFKVPNIDVCGGSSGIHCPGAGQDSYFYRCCSVNGHCGPKNDIQQQELYCGAGCQGAFGNCDTNRPRPASPTGPAKVVGAGGNCGPIVNTRCADGLCCSGSNFCGTGVDYCGAANWCQAKWGRCD